MNKIHIYLLAVVAIGCESTSEDILIRVSENLTQTNKLACSYSFEQVIPSMPDANWQAQGKFAFDFTKENALHSNIYVDRGGERSFQKLFVEDTLTSIKSETSTLVKTASVDRGWLYGNLALYFTPFELREVLPQVVSDTTTRILQVIDTTIQGAEVIEIQLELEKSIVAGKLLEVENAQNRYNLTVRKEDLLPIAWEIVLVNGGSIKMSFSDLSTTIADSIWQEPDQSGAYLVLSGEEYDLREEKALNSWVGQKMPDWELPTIDGDTLSNYSVQKKLTLYEFFFVGCIGSVKAKPYIDSLRSDFKDNLQVISIETEGFSKEGVESFTSKFHLDSPILYGGEELSSQLGIKGCPTFFLVDEKGTVVYAAFGNVKALKSIIEKEV